MKRVFAFAINDFQLVPCAVENLRQTCGSLALDQNGVFGLSTTTRGDAPLLRKGPRDRGASFLDELTGIRPTIALGYFETEAARDFKPQHIAPYRFRDWSFTMWSNFRAVPLAREHTLPIPVYIRKNLVSGSAEEIFFHLFLAFMHSSGKLGLDQPPVRDVYHALNGAASLIRDLSEVVPGNDGDPDPRFLAMLSNGRQVFALNSGRPLWFLHQVGIPRCSACEARNRDLSISDNPVPHELARYALLTDMQPADEDRWHRIPFDSVLLVRENLDYELLGVETFRT